MLEDDATTPSLQKMQDERDFERQRRSKFHGRALQWSRTVGEAQLFDVKEYANLFAEK